MLTMEKTADYVKRWVAAFESKDLDRVLAFYTDDVIFHSPLIARLSHDPGGTVQGKAALRAYVKRGFEVFDQQPPGEPVAGRQADQRTDQGRPGPPATDTHAHRRRAQPAILSSS